MANNKIPLALGFDPATNVNTGLEEFVLNLRDVGDVCETDPVAGQALVYDGDNYCPSTLPAPGEFTGNLSDVGQVCSATPSNGQALVWSGSEWCPSTIPTGGGGGGGVTSVNGDSGPDVSMTLGDVSGPNGTYFEPTGDPVPGSLHVPNGGIGLGGVTPAAGTFSVGPAGANQPATTITGSNGQLSVTNGAGVTTTLLTNGVIALDDGVEADTVLTSEGEIAYDDTNHTLAVHVGNAHVLHLGEDEIIETYNQTGGTVPAGYVAYVSGADAGSKLNISLADKDLPYSTQSIIGVLPKAIGNEGRGVLQVRGKLTMDTRGTGAGGLIAGSPTAGNPVYVGDNGQLTSNAPTGLNEAVINIGKVEIVAEEGSIYVDPRIDEKLNDLNNVDVDVNSVFVTDSNGSGVGLSGASGSIVYFENDPPRPGLETIANILNDGGYTIQSGATYIQDADNTVDPDNLDNGLTHNALIKVNSGGTGFESVTTTTNSETFLGTNANLKDLNDVDANELHPADDQDILQLRGSTWSAVTLEEAQEYQGTNGLNLGNLVNVESGVDDTLPQKTQSQVQSLIYNTATSSYTVSTLNHHDLSGLGDDDHTQYVLADGTRTVTGTLTVQEDSTGDAILVETTEDSSTAAPVITLNRNSASPSNGDYLGQLKFKGDSSTGAERVYAKITAKTDEVTNNNEAGLIELMVRSGGSNLITTRFTETALKLINGNGLEVDGTLDVTGNSTFTSGSITNTPTAANHIANKSYVDSQIPTASYLQAIASGSIASVADEALTLIGWATTGTYALTDPAGNLEVDSGEESSDSSIINVSGSGVYQVDATVRVSNTTERLGLVFRIYRDPGTGTFADIPELRTSNYASRGTGSGEGITNGSASINALLSLDQGDRLRFYVQPKTGGTASTIQEEGTYLRITKVN